MLSFILLKIRSAVITTLSITLAGLLSVTSFAENKGENGDHELLPYELTLTIPHMDSAKGKELYISKACITCHAINGIGGKDGQAIDAHAMEMEMSVFDFAAKMWNHSQGMVAVQIAALGEQVLMSGEELAHITAFVHDDKMQHTLTMEDIPHHIHDLMEHEH